MFELRPYQKKLVEELKKSILNGHRSICAVLGCGGGKSVIIGDIVKSATAKKNRVLFLVHRKELVKQITGTFANSGVDMNYCSCMMVQTATRRITKLPEPRIVVVDECFVTGTKIATPFGDKNIENVKVGDIVYCFDEQGNIRLSFVKQTFSKKTDEVLLKINNTICTVNHKFFTAGGWKQAKDLQKGDVIYELDLPKVRGSKKTTKRRFVRWMLSDKDGRKKPTNIFAKDEGTQPNEQSRSQRKNASIIITNRTQTDCSWRKRERIYQTSNDVVGSFRQRSCRVTNTDKNQKGERLSDLLQSGHSVTAIYVGNRGRRRKPLWGKTVARRKENGIIKPIRVESIEVYKQGNIDGLKKSVVYDLEVNRYHTYFANGIAVHNCHHVLSKSYTNIIEHFPKATVLGFTATPQRMNEGGLGKVFTTLVESVSTQWLIDNHYLAPFKAYSVPLADTSKLHIKRGEFDPEEVEQLMAKGTVFGGTYSNWERLAKGKKTIVYCSSIRTSKATTAVFQAHGISATHLDGTTPKKEREQAVQDFRDGKIQVLCNVDLFGEGFDVPDCECVVLLRPTKSLTLHIQQSMRSMRYREGKTAIILDHVGNFYRHGLPTEVHEWTLATKKNKQKSEVHIKECPNCFAALPTNAQVCPICGYSFEDEEETEREEKPTVDCELTEFKGRQINRYTQCKDFDELMFYTKKKGYKPFYAAYKAIEMGISFPPKYMWMKRWIERHAK